MASGDPRSNNISMTQAPSPKDPEQDARLTRLEQDAGLPDPVGYEYFKVKYTHWGEYVYYGWVLVSCGHRVNRPGEITYVNRIWAGNEIIYDRGVGFSKRGHRFRAFSGHEEQGLIGAAHYRGLYSVYAYMPLADYGDSYPQLSVELRNGTGLLAVMDYWERGLRSQAILNMQLDSDNDAIYYLHGPRAALSSVNPDNTGVHSAKYTLATKAQETYAPAINGFAGIYALDIGDPINPLDDGEGLDDVNQSWAVFSDFDQMLIGQNANKNGPDRKNDLRGYDRTNPANERFSLDVGFNARTGVYYTVSQDNNIKQFVAYANETTIGFSEFYGGGAFLFGNFNPPAEILCLAKGEQAYGETFIFAATVGGKVYQYRCTMQGVIDTEFYTAPGEVLRLQYDENSGNLIVIYKTVTNKAKAVSLDGDAVAAWTSEEFNFYTEKRFMAAVTSEATSDTSGGTLVTWAADYQNLNYIELETGNVTEVQAAVNIAAGGILGTGGLESEPNAIKKRRWFALIWNDRTNRAFTSYGQYFNLDYTIDTDESDDLFSAADAMRALAVYAGYPDEKVFTYGMDEMQFPGYLITSDTSLGALASSVGSLYGFTWTESADRLIFKAIYDESHDLVIDATVPANRLAYLGEGRDQTQTITVIRNGDLGLPLSLSLSFYNMDRLYNAGFQRYERGRFPKQTSEAVSPADMSMPITLTNALAFKLISETIYRVWASRLSYVLRLPPEYMVLDAGDVLRFTAEDITYEAQITRARINADNSVNLDLSEVEGSAYPMLAPAAEPLGVSTPSTPARVIILDIPNFNEGQDKLDALYLTVIAAPRNLTDTNVATVVEMKKGADSQWQPRLTIGSDGMGFIGELVAPAEYMPEWYETDMVNSIYILPGNIPAEMLANATESELNDDANLIAIGDYRTGTELIQFGKAELITGGIWRLYELRRGRYGTEVFQGLQQPGAPVAFLTNSRRIEYTAGDYAQNEMFLVRTSGSNDVLRIYGEGYSRFPYAPVNVELRRPTRGDDVTLSFTLRPRFANYPPNELPTTSNPGTDALSARVTLYSFDDPEQIIFRQIVSGDEIVLTAGVIAAGAYGDFDQLRISIEQVAANTVQYGFSVIGFINVITEDEQTLDFLVNGGGSITVSLTAEAEPGDIRDLYVNGGGDVFADVVMPGIIQNAFVVGGGEITVEPERIAFIDAYVNGGGDVTVELTAEIETAFSRWRVILGNNAGGPLQHFALRQMSLLTAPRDLGGERLDQPEYTYTSSGMLGTDVPSQWFDRVLDFNNWLLNQTDPTLSYMQIDFPEPVTVNVIGFDSQAGQDAGWPLDAIVQSWNGTEWVDEFSGATNITDRLQYRELSRTAAQAAPIFEGYTQNENETDGTSTTVPATGVVAGELLILHIGFGTNVDPASVAVSNGFTIPSNGRLEDSRAAGVIAYKIASASEPASYDISWTGTTSSVATLMRFSGASGDLDIATSSQGVSNTNTIQPAGNTVTEVLATRVILASGGWGDGVVTPNMDLTTFNPDMVQAFNGNTSGDSSNATTVAGFVQEGILSSFLENLYVLTTPHGGLYWESWSIVIAPGEPVIPDDGGTDPGDPPVDPPATPALVGSTTVTQTGNTDIVIPVPTGTAIGDLMIVHVGNNGGGGIQNATSSGSGTWTYRRPSALNGLYSEFHKIATAGDIGGNVTIDAAPATRTLPAIANLSVFHATEPGHTTFDVIGNLGGSNSNVAPSKVANAGDIVICGSVANAQATAVPSGMTELARAGGDGLGVAVAYKVAAAGETGAQAFSYSGTPTYWGASTTLIRSKP